MPRTPDRHPGPIDEDEAVYLGPQPIVPSIDGENRYVTGQGFRFYEEGIERGLDPNATQIGQVLFSVDGMRFTAQLPITAPDNGSAGWLVNDVGILVVVG